MNDASIAVLAVLFALVGLALWRRFKKGAPCECGGYRKIGKGGCAHEGGQCSCGCCEDSQPPQGNGD